MPLLKDVPPAVAQSFLCIEKSQKDATGRELSLRSRWGSMKRECGGGGWVVQEQATGK